jgi:hypothetical protein
MIVLAFAMHVEPIFERISAAIGDHRNHPLLIDHDQVRRPKVHGELFGMTQTSRGTAQPADLVGNPATTT